MITGTVGVVLVVVLRVVVDVVVVVVGRTFRVVVVLGFRHVLRTQRLEAQSVATRQRRPLAQGLHVRPPQSISVSTPFLRLSKQRDACERLFEEISS